jgi:hypothetical protein
MVSKHCKERVKTHFFQVIGSYMCVNSDSKEYFYPLHKFDDIQRKII